MDPSRAAELTELIQCLDAEIPVKPKLLALVDQALTHVSTGRARNLERLEFLGDAVLRLAATEFIDRHHTDLAVGCLLYTSPSPRDRQKSRMPSSA